MKKWLVSAMILLFCGVLCGCGALSKEIGAEELQLTFDCPAVIQMGEQQYGCYIFHSVAQQTEITVTGSGVLDGLQYRQNGSDASLFYDGMEYTAEKGSLPEEACFRQISDVLNDAQSYVNLEPLGEGSFAGTVNGEKFQLKADEKGRILQLKTEELTVVFDLPAEQ